MNKLMDSQPQTVEELKSMIESRHQVGESTSMAISVTGEKYIAFCNGIILKEGKENYPTGTKKAIILAQWKSFKVYSDAIGKDAILYWRCYPELSEHTIYMRLLLSYMPLIGEGRG